MQYLYAGSLMIDCWGGGGGGDSHPFQLLAIFKAISVIKLFCLDD